MDVLDWGVIAIYIIGIVGAGAALGRTQATMSDYYLAGRSVKWWQSGLSTMATQLGAISFISAPAFVALKSDGGLKWLAYEFGVPLAMILVMAIIIPNFHGSGVISIYEYLEMRFDKGTRAMVSLLFQIGRGLATAVSVLAGGLVISTALGVTTTTAILGIGLVTIVYDVLGGIRIVILSDVAQMLIIFIGVVACGGIAFSMVGWDAAWAALDPQRLTILDFNHLGLDPQGTYAFWPMMLGGFFLYASYYGCDQSQVQRELTVGNVDDVRKSLLFNAFGRFPIVLLYCLMGVFVGAAVAAPSFLKSAAQTLGSDPQVITATLQRDPDRMVPMFILSYLPHGLIGFIFVAILSALMSSLDSALNSMSAVTVRDFYQRYWKKKASDAHYLLVSKGFTLLWGVFCVTVALVFTATPEATRQTTIVLINAIGSVLYGPILAAFLLGMLTRWASARSTKIGIVAGVILNVCLWQFTTISWLWWNFTGFAMTVLVSGAICGLDHTPRKTAPLAPTDPPHTHWSTVYVMIGIYFFIMVGICRIMEGLT
ncbi:MAG: sodium:solute symporter [Candidatus Binatia bacterium]